MRPNPTRLLPALGLLATGLALVSGCAQIGLAPTEVDETEVRETSEPREPARVVVQHVLIAQEGAGLPGVTRTVEEAERLAGRVLERAQSGDTFDELVRLYGDDRHNGGIYAVANFGVGLEKAGEVERVSLVKAFGDAAFRMPIGAVEVVAYDAERSPYGFHVVKRIQ